MRHGPLIALLVGACLAGSAAAVEADRKALLEVRALLDGLEAKPESHRATVVGAIVAKGAVGAACVLELRSDYRKAAHVDVVSESLRRLGHPQLEPYLLSVIASGEAIDDKRIAFDRCAEYGGRSIVVPFARTMATNQGREKVLAERAFVAILDRVADPSVFRELEAVLPSLDTETRARVLTMVARSGSPHSLTLLGGALGRDAALDAVVLTAIGRVPASAFDETLVRRVRGYLTASEAHLRRDAALILGRWRDHGSVEPIIALLHDENPSVLKSAQWALAQITGLGFPASHERWSRWYEAELDWWENDGERCLETAAEAESEADAHAALLEIGKRSYAPPELGPVLIGLLDDPSAEIEGRARKLIERFGLQPPARH